MEITLKGNTMDNFIESPVTKEEAKAVIMAALATGKIMTEDELFEIVDEFGRHKIDRIIWELVFMGKLCPAMANGELTLSVVPEQGV